MNALVLYLVYAIGWLMESSYTRWANETDDAAL